MEKQWANSLIGHRCAVKIASRSLDDKQLPAYQGMNIKRKKIWSFYFSKKNSCDNFESGLIAILCPYAQTEPSTGLLITRLPKGYQHHFYINSQLGQADSTWLLCSQSCETGPAVMSADIFYHAGSTGGQTPTYSSSWWLPTTPNFNKSQEELTWTWTGLQSGLHPQSATGLPPALQQEYVGGAQNMNGLC